MHTKISNTEKSSGKLILLHLLFRHGNRTPTIRSSYKNDPHKNNGYEPYGYGQLTNEGKVTLHTLGKSMRSEYGDFLGKQYTHDIVDAQSTYYGRTQSSLQLFLAGLFPPSGKLVWNKKLLWQPTSYGHKDRHDDKMLLPRAYYKEFKALYDKHQQEIGVQDKYKDLFSFLSVNTGHENIDMVQIWRIYMTLTTQKEFGLALPKWTEGVYQKLYDLVLVDYEMEMATPKLRKILIGDLCNKIMEDTRNKLANKNNFKLHAYAAHELNVAHLLVGLKSFQPPHMPDYGSCVIIEVRQDNSETKIGVFYKPNPYKEMTPLPLWGQNPCTLGNFVTAINKCFES